MWSRHVNIWVQRSYYQTCKLECGRHLIYRYWRLHEHVYWSLGLDILKKLKPKQKTSRIAWNIIRKAEARGNMRRVWCEDKSNKTIWSPHHHVSANPFLLHSNESQFMHPEHRGSQLPFFKLRLLSTIVLVVEYRSLGKCKQSSLAQCKDGARGEGTFLCHLVIFPIRWAHWSLPYKLEANINNTYQGGCWTRGWESENIDYYTKYHI